MQSTRDHSLLSSPLSGKQKIICLESLKTMNIDALSNALIAAALPPLLHSFPEPMQSRLGLLQNFYRQSSVGSDLAINTSKLIFCYMQSEGLIEFKKILHQSPLDEAAWNSSLLQCLAMQLNIPLRAEPMVEATIQNGKVYWRVKIDNVIVHDRPAIKKWDVTFTPDNSWIIDWKLFREFKDSGKRHSPVRITKERFAQYFKPAERVFADAIWDELKIKRILNAKNRLSIHWRTLSDVTITLDAVESLKIANKNLLYAEINKILHLAANNPVFAETINGVPDMTIFRPERVLKNWAGTGRVTNNLQGGQHYFSKRWDVASHHELSGYRNSEFEKMTYKNVILNYDHVPSSSILKSSESDIKREYYAMISRVEEQLGALAHQGYPKTSYHLRNNPLTKEDLEANQACAVLEKRKKQYMKDFKKEAKQLAYCIAIPKALHKQSDTTMESQGGQLLRVGNPFVEDVSGNLMRLKKDPANFGIKFFDDYLHALGAYRFLYRVQSKPTTPAIANQTPVGRLAHTFFEKPQDKRDLDRFITKEAQEFIAKREGMK